MLRRFVDISLPPFLGIFFPPLPEITSPISVYHKHRVCSMFSFTLSPFFTTFSCLFPLLLYLILFVFLFLSFSSIASYFLPSMKMVGAPSAPGLPAGGVGPSPPAVQIPRAFASSRSRSVADKPSLLPGRRPINLPPPAPRAPATPPARRRRQEINSGTPCRTRAGPVAGHEGLGGDSRRGEPLAWGVTGGLC